jgi:hypothetical protein
MANVFVSGLKKFGQEALKVITFGAIAAKDAAPFISMFNPLLGQLLNGTATAVLAAETAGAAAKANAPDASTSTQKAALVVTAITPLAEQFCQQAGFDKPTPAQVQQFSDYIVAGLNVFGTIKQDVQKPA